MATVNAIANFAIVAGYVLVPVFWLPNLPLTKPVMLAAVVFFLTCAITHLSMALGFTHSLAMTVNHVVQAVAVFAFVIGFARLLRIARDGNPALLPQRSKKREEPRGR